MMTEYGNCIQHQQSLPPTVLGLSMYSPPIFSHIQYVQLLLLYNVNYRMVKYLKIGVAN